MPLYAHKKNNSRETIDKHHKNCKDIALKYNIEYNVDDKIKRWFKNFEIFKIRTGDTVKLSNDEIEFIIKAFNDTNTYHDIGKINPKMQGVNMNNWFKIDNIERMESFHSPISAYIYLNEKLIELNKHDFKEKLFIKYVLVLFSNVILSHHGHLKDLDENNFLSLMDMVESNDYLHFYDKEIVLKREFFGCISKVSRLMKFDYYLLIAVCRLLQGYLTSVDFISTTLFSLKASDLTIKSDDLTVDTDDFVINNIKDSTALISAFENTNITKGINAYKENKNYFKENNLPLINELRSDISLNVTEKIREKGHNHRIYNLEAPTGSGKTYTSIAAVMEILKNNPGVYKNLMYVFPINAISSQTTSILKGIFGSEIVEEVNSITPFRNILSKNNEINYERTLLDRQLLNYPMVLTSNIALWDILFGTSRESSLGITKLFDSIVILDEIQNYKNSIWIEMIEFLNKYSEMFNMKIIIMSATLPNLEELLNVKGSRFLNLLENPRKYYDNPLFKNRVNIDSNLLSNSVSFAILKHKMFKDIKERNEKNSTKSKYILEFIKKARAKEFYNYILSEINDDDFEIYELDGDDNILFKNEIIEKCKVKNPEKNIILITTQIIECGVDIDMDLGAKDCSFPDLDEQFIGRINRSCEKVYCKVSLFNLDKEEDIYKGDYRIGTNVSDKTYLDALINKNFKIEYSYVLGRISKDKHKGIISKMEDFEKLLKNHQYSKIKKHMELISDDTIQVFIPTIMNHDGVEYNGYEIWNEFLNILQEPNYSKKRYQLSHHSKKMNLFTYSVYLNEIKAIEPVLGVYYIEKGYEFLNEGKFDSKSFIQAYK